ncbi:MAG TPA: hypothetical protein VML91_28490 [Burkholderiales bacterium]|nr:hypothetical protein [Burkholderiales bacterium]
MQRLLSRLRAGSTIVAFTAVAVLAGCAPGRAPVRDERPEATPRSAGRVVGARIGVLEYGAACAAAYPALRPQLAAALQHWRLRNDAVVGEVRERYLASLDSATERAALEAELARIGIELRAGFAARPEAERSAFCRRFLVYVEEGREDVGFKYREDVAAWLAAP